MFYHKQLSKSEFISLAKKGQIAYGGNRKLKIFGLLSCSSGKRMTKENRVFFDSEDEAIRNGYRPCGHCMKERYDKWKELKRG